MMETDVIMDNTDQSGNHKLVREVITYRQNRKGKPLKVSIDLRQRYFINKSPLAK